MPRWHVVWGTGRALTLRLIEKLRQCAQRQGVRLELRFEHRVERLIMQDGRVIGVAGAREDTGAAFEHFGAAVLVAAGGITGNVETDSAGNPRTSIRVGNAGFSGNFLKLESGCQQGQWARTDHAQLQPARAAGR